MYMYNSPLSDGDLINNFKINYFITNICSENKILTLRSWLFDLQPSI